MVLAGAWSGLDCCAGTIEHRITLVSRDSFEGLAVAFTIEDEPLVVPEELVLLLGLVNLFLVGQQFLFRFLFTNPTLKFVKEFIYFISSHLRLIYHQGTFLSQCSQTRHDLLCPCIVVLLLLV